jgi:hypothetical protein
MRTTVTLEDDVAAAIAQLCRDHGVGVSESVNRLARAGMTVGAGRPSFRQRSSPMGSTIDVTNVAEALEMLDGPASR